MVPIGYQIDCLAVTVESAGTSAASRALGSRSTFVRLAAWASSTSACAAVHPARDWQPANHAMAVGLELAPADRVEGHCWCAAECV